MPMATPPVDTRTSPAVRRSARQRVQPVFRRGVRRGDQPGAAFPQLVVERQAGQVRAAHCDVDGGTWHGGCRTSRRPRQAARTQRAGGGCMQSRAVCEQIFVLPCRRDQCHAEGQATRGEAGGYRDGGQVLAD